MTVKELAKRLESLIEDGSGDKQVVVIDEIDYGREPLTVVNETPEYIELDWE